MRSLILNSFCLMAILSLSGCGGGGDSGKTLVMFCAAGMKKPVEAIAKQYEEEYGVKIELQYAGSGDLLATLQIVERGDIYLAADSSYTEKGKEKGLIAETMTVGYMLAGYGVATGNPKGVTSLADLQREDLKVAIGDPDATSVGKFTKKILSKHGAWENFKPTTMFPTVNELANAINVGSIDAAILWDAMANQIEEVDFIHLPEFDSEKKDITVAVVKSTKQATEALRFCRYLTAHDKGLKTFKADGYEVIEGDVWALEPELSLFSGAMLRPAIEESIKVFEEREGVKINTVYNGCGVLVANMKAGSTPDAYFSCDVKFLDMVQDRFRPSTLVSANEMVLLVAKGNPKNLKVLADLKNLGLRIGLAHAEKSALGYLTKVMLETEGVYEPIIASGNLKVDSPTGDFLVNQIKSGSLDAVIVYKSNAMAASSTLEDFDLVEIGKPEAIAEQPFAVAKDSGHQQLLERFLDTCVGEEGKSDFLKYGFRWELAN
ncbi:MAG: molybdate transport system substrate-binding protein [Verrucomicrobiales bacterium]|jgi:molybdate transport system substrate-binding protein